MSVAGLPNFELRKGDGSDELVAPGQAYRKGRWSSPWWQMSENLKGWMSFYFKVIGDQMVDCSYIFKSSHWRYWVASRFFVVSALGLIGRAKVSCIASHNFRGKWLVWRWKYCFPSLPRWLAVQKCLAAHNLDDWTTIARWIWNISGTSVNVRLVAVTLHHILTFWCSYERHGFILVRWTLD